MGVLSLPSVEGSMVLPLIQMTQWSENDEIRRDAVQGLSSLAISDENRKVIVDFGGFPALFACFEVSADTVSTHGDRQSSDRPCSSSAGVRGGGSMRHAAAVVDVMEEQPLKHLTSIVSLKKAASKLHRRTRYYAIKRLAVEAIANLLIEKENQSAFVELSGVSLFRNLIRTNEVFYQEQKRICVALFNLSKNEKMRKLLYEKGLMLILRDVVDEGTTDLIVSVLRALRNCAGPIFRDEGLPKAAKKEMDARQTISWTAEDIKFVSSLLLRSQDVRMSKLLLDIVRFIGGQEDYATDIIKFGGPQLLAKFFEASCSCTASTSVRDSGQACIEALTKHDKSQSLLQSEFTKESIFRMPELLHSSLKKKSSDPEHAQAAEKLRSTTRCILDLCRGCTSAKEWMGSQQFVVALLQLVRTEDIVAARCAAAILGELISKSTFSFVLPYFEQLLDCTIHMETDKMAQLSMIRVLETMCQEDKSCVSMCAKRTEPLVKLCEKLCKHCINDDVVDIEEKRSIIKFVMNVSFDPSAQATLQAMLPILKHIQNLLQHSDAKVKEYTVIFIHNVYTCDSSKAIQLAAQSIWNIKHFARARTNTEAGEKAGEIANHYSRDLAAQYIQRIYRSYRAKKYLSKLGMMASYDERIKQVYAKMATSSPRATKASAFM